MRPTNFRFQVATFAVMVGFAMLAARPAVADEPDVAIDYVDTSENGSIVVKVAFDWSFPESTETGELSYRADIYLDQLDFHTPQTSVPLSAAKSVSTLVVEFLLDPGTPGGCYDVTVVVTEVDEDGLGTSSAEDTRVDAVCIGGPPTEEPIGLPVDIKPGSCPNPIQTGKRGVIPVAVVGTEDQPVSEIDPNSVTLMGVPPLRFNYEDVATPYFPVIDDADVDCLDCTTARGDGIVDMTLKFDAREVVAAIRDFYGDSEGNVEDRACLVLFLEGELTDGSPILGADIVRIQETGKKGGSAASKSKPNKEKPKKKKKQK